MYLGTSYQVMKQCRQIFRSNFHEIEFYHDLEEITRESEPDYMALMERLNTINRANLIWWFTSVSTRCPLLTNVYQDLCYVRLIERMCRNHQIPDIIVVESPALMEAVRTLLAGAGYQVLFLSDPEELNCDKTALFSQFSLKILLNMKKSVKTWYSSLFPKILHNYIFFKKGYDQKVSLRHAKKERKVIGNHDMVIMLVTFFFQDSLRQGRFFDRYFPYLYEFLKNNGVTPLVYPRFQVEASVDLYTGIYHSEEEILIPEGYLSFTDYISGFFSCLLGKWRITIRLSPDDPCYLLEKIIRQEIDSNHVIDILPGFLTYRAAGKVFEKFPGIHSIILWNENQYEDRAIMKAARENDLKTPVLGFRGYIHPTNYHNVVPLPSEVKAGITPDTYLITGTSQRKFVTKYTPGLKTSVVAALRYNHLYEEKKPGFQEFILHQRKCIVVILPGMEQAMEIIDTVYSSLEEGDFNLPCYIRDHPNCPYNAVETDKTKDSFMPYSGTIMDLPSLCPIIISGTTSAIIEALSMGIPSIFLARKNSINFDQITDEVPHYYRCYTSGELIKTIHAILNREPDYAETILLSRRIREDFFTPVSDGTMKPFIAKSLIGLKGKSNQNTILISDDNLYQTIDKG